MTKTQEIASRLGLTEAQVAEIIAFENTYVALTEETGTWEARDLFGDKVAQRRAELAAERAEK